MPNAPPAHQMTPNILILHEDREEKESMKYHTRMLHILNRPLAAMMLSECIHKAL